MPLSPKYRPEKRHARLGDSFFDPVEPACFPQHVLRFRNQRWAARTGLDELTQDEWRAHFGRFEPLPGSFEKPLALRYHGHQFRHYNHELGDGRGFLFAQLRDVKDNRLLDLGTKGSGQTPWSRRGDGKLTLKGGVREVLATEMLEALGVETSKTFSLIETGEALMRGDEPSPTRSSVMVRLSHSHVRIGTFQRQAFLGDTQALARLLEYAIAEYKPWIPEGPIETRAALFLEDIAQKVARMGAQWMAAGFVHGVLNTDNINITGESFDYGPWRFAPTYDSHFTAAYFDEHGLYAFGRQPGALGWNLARLGECLLPLSSEARIESALKAYEPALQREFALALLRRFGLKPGESREDALFAKAFMEFMVATRAPYEQTFFDWFCGAASTGRAALSPSAEHYKGPEFDAFRARMDEQGCIDEARLHHAYFQQPTPCSMLVDEVEAIWAPIAQSDDWSAFEAKLAQIAIMRQAYSDVGA